MDEDDTGIYLLHKKILMAELMRSRGLINIKNLYTRESHISLGSLSLYEKKEPILKLLTYTMLKSTLLKYLGNKIKSSVLNFSDCCPNYDIEK